MSGQLPAFPTPPLNDGFSANNSSTRAASSTALRNRSPYSSSSASRANNLSSASRQWSALAHTPASSASHGLMSTSGNGGGSSMRSRRSQLSSRNSATLRMWSRRACRGEQDQQRRFERGVVEQVITGSPPPLLERQQRRDLVVHIDPRRQPRLDRERGENPLRERVQRAYRGIVERIEGAGCAVAHDRIAIVASTRFQLRRAPGRATRPRPSP